MNGRIFVSTTSQRRAQEWERIFGTAVLPVQHDQPRRQSIRNRLVLAYDLDLAALHPGQMTRLAGHVSRKSNTPYPVALRNLQTAVSWPIEATDDTYITEAAEEANSPTLPLFAPGQMSPAWWHRLHLPSVFPT